MINRVYDDFDEMVEALRSAENLGLTYKVEVEFSE